MLRTTIEIYIGQLDYFILTISCLEQVWYLAGRKTPIKGRYTNWQRFGKAVAKELKNAHSTDNPHAYKCACNDLWIGLQTFEENDPEFVKWLVRLRLAD
jgi:hypothetical protein